MKKNIKKIEQIIDKEGNIYNAKSAINIFRPFTNEFHQSRMNDDVFCLLCGMPVMFTSNGKTRYIKHKPMKEESKCPWHTGVTLTPEQVDALKYNGAKEGKKHIRYKNFLFDMFKIDESFSNEALEKRQTIKIDNKVDLWRRPDVSATYKNEIEIVCEVQLQTILVKYIKGRQSFYAKKKAFLIWFFDDKDIKSYSYSDGDIFFTNNTNRFFLNDEVITLSRENNSLVVGVKYYDYYLDENNEINFKSISKIIPFGSITFDEKTREVYYFDSRAKKKRLEDEIFINTPVEIGEIFEYNDIKFKLLMAKSGKLHIHYLNSNNLWRGGKYHGFHDDVCSAKREIVLILNNMN